MPRAGDGGGRDFQGSREDNAQHWAHASASSLLPHFTRLVVVVVGASTMHQIRDQEHSLK